VWPETRDRVQLELAQIRHLLNTNSGLLDKVRDTEPDSTELMALSALLHSFYTGIENIFKRIALEIDGSLPTGMSWHTDLLRLVSRETDSRRSVISDDLRAKLGEYMDFRHVFRHAYSFDLKWRKMAGLVLSCGQALSDLETQLFSFFDEPNADC